MGLNLFGTANSTILLVSYIIYLVCGLAAIVAGVVYVGGTGTMGDTGAMLLLLGFFFLVVGGFALLGWFKKNGIILLVVELVMIALYFIMFVVIIAAVMLGSGARDPIDRMFNDNWDKIKKDVYGGNPAANRAYVETCRNNDIAVNHHCHKFFGNFQIKDCVPSPLNADEATKGQYGLNCTKFDDLFSQSCSTLKTQCSQCEVQCRNSLIEHAKEKNVVTCVICIILTLYMVAVVAMHTLARNGLYTSWEEDESSDEEQPKPLCCKDMGIIGWLLILMNVVFSCLGMTVLLLGTFLVKDPASVEGGDFDFDTAGLLWIVLLLVGLVLFAIPVFQIVLIALHKAPNYIADIVVTVLIFVMMLVCVFLGFLSGALIEDINSLYDDNYAKYRGELELYDPSYCSLDLGECGVVTGGQNDGAGNSQIIYPVTFTDDADRPKTNMDPINADELWENQHSALQDVPFENLAPNNFLHSCHSSDLCIRCKPALDILKSVTPAFKFERATIRGSASSRNASDLLEANVDAWTWALYNTTEGNRNAKFALKKCEVALDRMSGRGRDSLWNAFPNPAANCSRVHFAVRYSFEGEVKDEYTGEVLKKADHTTKPETYASVQECAEYLLDMVDPPGLTDAEKAKVCPDPATCRNKVKANFALVYHYMQDSSRGFCLMPDTSCKQKIQYALTSQMLLVGIIGIFLLVFQLGVIFTTYWGIQAFGILCFGGGDGDNSEGDEDEGDDDDDDDYDDDDDDSNE